MSFFARGPAGRIARLAAIALLATAGASSAEAQWLLDSIVANPDPSLLDGFGRGLAIGNEVMIVGKLADDDMAANSGAGYVFRRTATSWELEVKLKAPDIATGGGRSFGASAGRIDDATIFFGAPSDDEAATNAGAAYFFRWSDEDKAWIFDTKILATEGIGQGGMGETAANTEDLAVFGAPGDNSFAGAAHVYRLVGGAWIKEAKLVASDPAASAQFGRSLAVFGDTLLAGTLSDELGTDNGSAYVFRFDGTSWNQEAKLLPPDVVAGDEFGAGVALRQDLAFAGAPRHDTAGPNAGACYIFRREGTDWTQVAKLFPSDPQSGGGFGGSTALGTGFAFISAASADMNASGSGAAYHFAEAGGVWLESQKFLRPPGFIVGMGVHSRLGPDEDVAVFAPSFPGSIVVVRNSIPVGLSEFGVD